VTIYPNPATDNLSITAYPLYRNESIEIFSSAGETVFKSEIRNPKSEIDISFLINGIYFIKVTSMEGKVTTAKFQVVRKF
jgi:hypothetical protein